MNTINKTIFAALAVLLPSQALCQPGLEECISMAYGNYPQIEEYNLIETSRKYDLSNAAMAWIPQLSVSGSAKWQSDVVEMPFEMPGFEFNIPHDQYGVTADLTQQIWDGGATGIKRKLVDAGADVKSKQLDVNLYSIRSTVQNVYLGIVLIDRQLKLDDLLKASLERSLEEVTALVNAGVAYESDKDQIKVNLLSCEQQNVSLLTDRKAYVKMLSLLTGSEISPNGEFRAPSITRTLATEVNRPELALYDAQAKQAQLQRDQIGAGLSPRLNLNLQAGYGRPGLNMLSGEFDTYLVAGLKLQWNIGNFYTLHNDRAKADANARSIELARSSFLLNTSIEAARKQSEIDKAADVLARDEEIITLRENIRKTAELQYKEGILKMNDYLNMLDEEFKARLNYDVHDVQYMMALYDLQNTLGTPDNQ